LKATNFNGRYVIMDKKATLAIFLSLAVWLAWSYFFLKPEQRIKPAAEKTQVTKEVDVKTRPVQQTVLKTAAFPAAKEEVIAVETETYAISLTNRGAAITQFKYRERDVELIVPGGFYNQKGVFDFALHLGENDFLNGNGLESALWSVEKITDKKIKFSTPVVLSGEKVMVAKTYTFAEKGYSFNVSYTVTNTTGKDITVPGECIISPSDFIGPALDFTNSYNVLNSIYMLEGSFEKERKGNSYFSEPRQIKKETKSTQWIGIMSRYFLLIMIPEKTSGSGVVYDNREKKGFRTGMIMGDASFPSGRETAWSFKVYVGEKNKDKLRTVDERIVDAADISKWIEPIRDFLLWSLLKINMMFHNLGWSLVIFSILTKVLLLPLTMKSTESMKKLQLLNPQINEIRAKYKDKPEVMNKKVMELYKKNKVNPLGGCLPLLVQMPFFFALYSALINAIDLWHAPFIFWINDLSMPDTIFSIQGFNINILPIVMTATTYLQQKMTTGDGGGQQQKMLMMMPLVFIVIFWNMPSGLVLYWTLQNVLQILNQWYINTRSKKADAAAQA
jgi:YidC/Oxa1 family membrane protein insertase